MNDDTFNMSVRAFLKKVGVTSQREIEAAVRTALSRNQLRGSERLQAKAVITLAGTELHLTIEDEIELG
jgi:hypothetical protein